MIVSNSISDVLFDEEILTAWSFGWLKTDRVHLLLPAFYGVGQGAEEVVVSFFIFIFYGRR